jgi:hypothetical protein
MESATMENAVLALPTWIMELSAPIKNYNAMVKVSIVGMDGLSDMSDPD